MSIMVFTVIAIAIPGVALLAAILLARASDRIAAGVSRSWRLRLYGGGASLYAVLVGLAWFEGSNWEMLLNALALLVWSGAFFVTARTKQPTAALHDGG